MDEGSVCVANITKKGRIRRAVMGAVVLGATAAAWFAFLRNHWGAPLSIVALFPPVAFGWLCIQQAAANT